MNRGDGIAHERGSRHSLITQFRELKQEARVSFETFAPDLYNDVHERRGWRPVWRFVKAMFLRLTPARRLILLLAIALLLGSLFISGSAPGSVIASSRMLFGAGLLLLLLGLELADRVAMKRDLEVAHDIQRWLLPLTAPSLPGVAVAFDTRPAKIVGGDYYDVVSLPCAGPSVLLVVADIAGKGVPAGLLMAGFRACLHTLADTAQNLTELATRLHGFCCADSEGGRHYTTAVLVQFDAANGSLSYVNAGHNPPLLRRSSGAVVTLEANGLPFGLLPSTKYQADQISVGSGDFLLLYTDGVVEAVNKAGDEYGLDRLRAFVRNTPAPPEECRQQLFASIDAFAIHAPQHDDITCMIVDFFPQTAVAS